MSSPGKGISTDAKPSFNLRLRMKALPVTGRVLEESSMVNAGRIIARARRCRNTETEKRKSYEQGSELLFRCYAGAVATE